MKIKNGIISVLIALMMLVSMAAPAFAAQQQSAPLTVAVDKTSVVAGEDVTITFTLGSAVSDVVSFNFYVEYDSSVFTYDKAKSGIPGDYTMAGYNDLVHTIAKTTPSNSYFPDVSFAGIEMMTSRFDYRWSMPAGVFYKLVLTAKESITQEDLKSAINLNAVINALSTVDPDNTSNKYNAVVTVNGKPSGMDMSTHERNGDVENVEITINETTTPAPSDGYTVSIAPGAEKYNSTETAYVNVNVNKGFAAAELILTYDTSVLGFDPASAENTLNGATAKLDSDTTGKIIIERYGNDVSINDSSAEFVLAFDIADDTTAASTNVTLTSAGFSEAATASAENLSPVTEGIPAVAVININPVYNVTLPAGFTGGSTVPKGDSYTFTADNANYDYTFTAIMGDGTATVTDNGNGSYTVAGVTGNLSITVASQTGKTRNVTVNKPDDVTVNAADTATYGTDYTFTITTEEGFNNPISVTIGGNPYTDFNQSPDGNVITVTIPGADITGEIGITVGKVQSQFEVKIKGAAGDVTGESTANLGEAYLFQVNKEEGFEYTVEIKVGDTVLTAGEDFDVTTEGNVDKYSIHVDKVTGDITITVTKTAPLAVEIYQYVTMDGAQMFLVTATGTTGEGKVFTYNNTPMYYSDKYEAYCFLVIANSSFTKEEAAANVATASVAAPTKVVYDKDVNKSGIVDANDAQLVYNMYNAKYASFSEADMTKFLSADVNGDKKVDVEDADAIVDFIIANR